MPYLRAMSSIGMPAAVVAQHTLTHPVAESAVRSVAARYLMVVENAVEPGEADVVVLPDGGERGASFVVGNDAGLVDIGSRWRRRPSPGKR